MRERTNERKSNNLIKLIVLFIFTQIVTMTAARYISTTSSRDEVEIASFITNLDVSESVKKFELTDLYPGCEDKVFTFSISNNSEEGVSEVTNGYSFSIESMGNLPLIFDIEVDKDKTNNTGTTASQVINSNEKFWNGGILPNSVSTTHYYKVTVSWNEEANDADYSQEIDMIIVKVKSEQID